MATCPTPTKRAFYRRGAAADAAWLDSIVYQCTLRPYRCRCGRWHLTTTQPGRRRRQHPAALRHFRQAIADAIAREALRRGT